MPPPYDSQNANRGYRYPNTSQDRILYQPTNVRQFADGISPLFHQPSRRRGHNYVRSPNLGRRHSRAGPSYRSYSGRSLSLPPVSAFAVPSFRGARSSARRWHAPRSYGSQRSFANYRPHSVRSGRLSRGAYARRFPGRQSSRYPQSLRHPSYGARVLEDPRGAFVRQRPHSIRSGRLGRESYAGRYLDRRPSRYSQNLRRLSYGVGELEEQFPLPSPTSVSSLTYWDPRLESSLYDASIQSRRRAESESSQDADTGVMGLIRRLGLPRRRSTSGYETDDSGYYSEGYTESC